MPWKYRHLATEGRVVKFQCGPPPNLEMRVAEVRYFKPNALSSIPPEQVMVMELGADLLPEDGADADLFGRQSAEDRRMTVVPLGVNFWAHLALGRWYRCEEAICVSCEKSNECWKGSRENYLGGARPHCGRCWHALYMGRLGSPP